MFARLGAWQGSAEELERAMRYEIVDALVM